MLIYPPFDFDVVAGGNHHQYDIRLLGHLAIFGTENTGECWPGYSPFDLLYTSVLLLCVVFVVCVCVRVLGSDGAKLQTTYCLIFTFVLIKKHWRGDREPATYLTTTTFVLLKWALGRVASPLLATVLYTILCAYTEILCKCCRPTICSFVQAMTTHANKLNECFPQIVGWHRERGVVECQ